MRIAFLVERPTQFEAPFFRFAAEAVDEEEACEQLAVFLTSPRIRERADDDLTLLLATCR